MKNRFLIFVLIVAYCISLDNPVFLFQLNSSSSPHLYITNMIININIYLKRKKEIKNYAFTIAHKHTIHKLPSNTKTNDLFYCVRENFE